MEFQQISSCPELNNFIGNRQTEILNLAQRNTEEIVKKEMALMDFEFLLGLDLQKKDREMLTKESRDLREESWKELEKESKGDFNELNQILDNI